MLHRVAQLKPSLSDLYNVEYAWFVDVFGRLAKPAYMKYAFFIEGGTLGGRERPQDRLRLEGAPQPRAGDRAGRRASRSSTCARRSTAAPATRCRSPTPTRSRPTSSRSSAGRASSNPKLRFPLTAEVERDVAAAEQQALDEVERAFADNPDDIAAIIVEPIQGEGGDNHFRAEFLQGLERKAREHDVFFVLDEVQTGFGITGKMWAHEHFGLRPDALAFGKKAQVCGCLVGPKVDEEPENVFKVSSRINSTWGGGLTDMVRCARYLEIIDEDGLLENARVVGERLLEGLRALERELGGLVTNARGRGLMIAFDLPSRELRERAQDRMLANGLLLLGCGVRSIRFRPPLNLAPAEADAALEIVRKSLKEL